MSDELKHEPAAFYCGHCGAANPPYVFTFNRKDLSLLGTAEYCTISCGALRPAMICGNCAGRGVILRDEENMIAVAGSAWLTIECPVCHGAVETEQICGRIFSVALLSFTPSSALIQQARAQGFKT
jgi:hypothetical protein